MIELNRSRNNVVLSRRAVLEEERKDQRQRILDKLNPGDVVEGQISNIVDFGAFVDLDGMDGLIHISELSWSHVNHPSEVLEIGQTVSVKVLDIDRERQRISLGLKQTQADPWQQVLEAYKEGDVVDGKVTKVVTFGAFVEILPGVEGLVHISELAQHHVENPREVVAQGQDVKVLILEVDAERRRLSLSMKRVDGEGDGAATTTAPQLTPNLGLSEEVFARGRRCAGGRRSTSRDAEAEVESRLPSSRLERSRAEAAGCRGRALSDAEPEERRPSPRPSRCPTSRLRRGRRGCRARGGAGAGAEPEPEPDEPEQPLNVAITGGIGAGKSEALRAFGRHGAATISSDEIVHELIEDDPEVRARCSSGSERRRRSDIAEVVFADREALAWLEALLHPRVVLHYLAWRERQTAPLASPRCRCSTRPAVTPASTRSS